LFQYFSLQILVAILRVDQLRKTEAAHCLHVNFSISPGVCMYAGTAQRAIGNRNSRPVSAAGGHMHVPAAQAAQPPLPGGWGRGRREARGPGPLAAGPVRGLSEPGPMRLGARLLRRSEAHETPHTFRTENPIPRGLSETERLPCGLRDRNHTGVTTLRWRKHCPGA
jgi:hypothetical protein